MGNQICVAPDCTYHSEEHASECRPGGRDPSVFSNIDALTSGGKALEDEYKLAEVPESVEAAEDAAALPKPQDSHAEAAESPDGAEEMAATVSKSEVQRLLVEAKEAHIEEQAKIDDADRARQMKSDLLATRNSMRQDNTTFGTSRVANRYGMEPCLPQFVPGKHVPLLGLLNPMSGAMAGMDILAVCRATPYYQDRMFNIIEVVRGRRRGGMLDVFRMELSAAKDEARAQGTRPRLISGGGDGTGSFSLFIVFLALAADPKRSDLVDTGNGFIWTDDELVESFPALVQMPLGSANDFANILGWGQKYPGSRKLSCTSHAWSASVLGQWFAAAMDPASKVVNFDIWGIVPREGETKCDFKLAALSGKRGPCPNTTVDGKRQVHLAEAGKPVPFFVCLYFSAGFGAYMTARFQLNRHKTPVANRMEYARQGAGVILERTPPQMHLRLDNVEFECEGQPYFPPRRHRGIRGRGYREAGFYNINWQAHALHGADRAGMVKRLTSKRKPVRFNDGKLDMFRWKFASLLKNPGLRVQTDKKKDMMLRFTGGKGTGIFFQWDGEARFAFSPTGEDFHIFIRQVMNIPVVLGPWVKRSLIGDIDDGRAVQFAFCGDSEDEQRRVRERILTNIRGDLDLELNATLQEMEAMSFPTAPPAKAD
mmetsp:Transcript_125720/g.352104  ORF Transcript_125720/g.352104 Transcript_125720/m.352104 type:complete len:654 (+) Transcript_125720:99-2060(+)